MKNMKLALSFLAALALIIVNGGALMAQKEEKSLQKVLTSRNLKEIYEIRALKIKTITERSYCADVKGNIAGHYDTEKIERFNEEGNLIENEVIRYDQGARRHIPVQKWKSEFNSNGLVETEISYYYDQKLGGYIESQKTSYEYDEKQNLIVQATLNVPTGALIEKIVNKYDEKNNKIESARYADNKLINTACYKYDLNKNELECLVSGADGNIIEKTSNTYNDGGIKIETVIYKGPSCLIHKKIIYNNLACVLKVEKYSGGGLISAVYNAYDDSGNKTEETEITAAGARLYLETYAYDQLNNLTEKTRYNCKNRIESKEVYKYDELNRRIGEFYYAGGDKLKLNKSVANAFNNLRQIEESKAFDEKKKPLYKNVFLYEYRQ